MVKHQVHNYAKTHSHQSRLWARLKHAMPPAASRFPNLSVLRGAAEGQQSMQRDHVLRSRLARRQVEIELFAEVKVWWKDLNKLGSFFL